DQDRHRRVVLEPQLAGLLDVDSAAGASATGIDLLEARAESPDLVQIGFDLGEGFLGVVAAQLLGLDRRHPERGADHGGTHGPPSETTCPTFAHAAVDLLRENALP